MDICTLVIPSKKPGDILVGLGCAAHASVRWLRLEMGTAKSLQYDRFGRSGSRRCVVVYSIYDGFQTFRGKQVGVSPESALAKRALEMGTTFTALLGAGWSARLPDSENKTQQ